MILEPPKSIYLTRHDRVKRIVAEVWDYPEVSDCYCKYFGCGNKLSPAETLYGDYCLFHQQRITPIQLIDKYLQE